MRVSKISLVVLLLFATILMMFPLPSPVGAIYSAGQIQWCKGITSTAQTFGTFSFGGGCISPVSTATFSPTDGSAFILMQMADISETATYYFLTQWRDPNGDLCNECNHESGGITFNVNAITISDSIQIAGRLPASRPGAWSMGLLVSVNGMSYVSMATSSFTIGSTQTAPTTFGVTVGVTPSVTQVTVDGQASAAGTKFTWNQGDQHTLSAKKTVAGDKPGTQYVFTGWSDGVSDATRTITINSNAVYTAQYKTQYQLTVNSDYGSATGADWYDEGSKTNAVLDTSTVSDGPLYNWVFTGWTDDASGTNLKSNPITMDNPKTATATWSHEFSMIFYAVIVAVIAVVAVVAVVAMMRRGKGPKAVQEAPTSAPPTKKLTGKQKYCAHCRAVIPKESTFCSSCGQST
jgi:uncharacterized repeat protein (TIGR02543 family)